MLQGLGNSATAGETRCQGRPMFDCHLQSHLIDMYQLRIQHAYRTKIFHMAESSLAARQSSIHFTWLWRLASLAALGCLQV